MNSFDKVVEALDKGHYRVINNRGSSAMAQCPGHDDHEPSLSITYQHDKVLLKCHSHECDVQDIVAAIDLSMTDLFDGEPDKQSNRMQIAEYKYTDADGVYLFSKYKFFPKDFRIGVTKGTSVEWGLPANTQPWLYQAPLVKRALDEGEVVYVVEGEKDVHAVEQMGGVATTQPHGAGGGKWTPWHSSVFRRATDVRIIRDRDDVGIKYAAEIVASLTAAGVQNVSLWEAKEGKDAHDHKVAGYGLDDLVRVARPQIRSVGIMADELLQKEFPPLIYAVESILPQGVAILAGSPKSGKSWMSLDMAIGVATGGICMSGLRCSPGDVLYIGLEDSQRRMKSRMELLTAGSSPNLERMECQTIESGWIGGETGLEWMQDWASIVDEPRMVVVDTLRKAEPHLDESRNQYIAEQEVMLRYKRFADRNDLTVLLLHHNNKSNDDGDWMNKFSGSKGLTGGADTLMYIDYTRGERDGFLRVDGRDVIADDVPIYKPRGLPFWCKTKTPDTPQDEEWWSAEAMRQRVEEARASREDPEGVSGP